MKKCIFLLFFAFSALSCEVDPNEPMCWNCEFSSIHDYWEETVCDMTYDEMLDYEYQVYDETGGELTVECY